MASVSEGGDAQVLDPNEAFSVLGNETRLQILQELGKADDALSFTELRERVGIHQGGQFNYHLDKVVGHFVEKTDDGYSLRQPGERVVNAVLSGAVTHDPRIPPTQIDEQCYYCGTPIYLDYRDEKVGLYCPSCEGNFGSAEGILTERWGDGQYPKEMGAIGFHQLPPAGIRGRTPSEVHQAAAVRIEHAASSKWAKICPECSAPLEMNFDVCENHQSTPQDSCEECGNLQAILLEFRCTNCILRSRGIVSAYIKAAAPLLDVITSQGLDPTNPSSPMDYWDHFVRYEEEVLSTNPFEARFSFKIGDVSMALTVNNDLEITNVERSG